MIRIVDRADAILKLSLAAAALMAGGGIGYYYGLFLPGQAREIRARAEIVERQRQEEAAQTASEQTRRSEARQLTYQDCVASAELAYKSRWTASCRNLHQRDLERLADCRDDLFASDAACAQKHPVRPQIGCELASDTAAAYAADLDQDKAMCQRDLEAAAP